MGVPNTEVGYTSAMSRREDHEVHKDMWGIERRRRRRRRSRRRKLIKYIGPKKFCIFYMSVI